MDKLAVILNFLLDILTLGINYKLRKRKQQEQDNEKKKQDELPKK